MFRARGTCIMPHVPTFPCLVHSLGQGRLQITRMQRLISKFLTLGLRGHEILLVGGWWKICASQIGWIFPAIRAKIQNVNVDGSEIRWSPVDMVNLVHIPSLFTRLLNISGDLPTQTRFISSSIDFFNRCKFKWVYDPFKRVTGAITPAWRLPHLEAIFMTIWKKSHNPILRGQKPTMGQATTEPN